MSFPILTKRLWIYHMAYSNKEFATIAGWLNNPEVVKYSEQRHRRHDLQTQISYFDGLKYGDKYVGIYHEDLLIGTMTSHFDLRNNVANVGIVMGEKSQWGKGLGQEAWAAFCNELFKEGIRKIEAGCMSINRRMMAICQHYGMVEEGRQDKHFICGNEISDLVHWGKFNETS